LGIKKVAQDLNPDILLIDGRVYAAKGCADRPVILLDCSEKEDLSPPVKETIHRPQVKAVLKHSKYRSADCYKIKQSDFEKIKVVCSYGTFKNPKVSFCVAKNCIEKLDIDLQSDHPIDVFFSGNVGYSSDDVSYHRQKAVYNLMQTNCIKLVATGRRDENSSIHFPIPDFFSNWIPQTDKDRSHLETIRASIKLKNLVLNRSLYEWTMRHSKIVFSPWGNGVVCIRDLEAILAGAVLIKPDSDFVETLPDIHQSNKTYVPCKTDFSDLQEKIDMVLNDWASYEEMRANNYDLVIEYLRSFPRYFSDIIRDAA
jgi:hypothetical protein